jgi:hypothetical protein
MLVARGARATPANERPVVAVVQSATWSPGDATREGAEEFSVLMSLAKVRRDHALAGLVGVSGRHGVFQTGAERALRFAVLSGVPVVKVSTHGDVAICPDDLFIDGGGLAAAEACHVLAAALEHCGAPPHAVDPLRPTAPELVAIRAHVRRLQQQFALAGALQVARN